VEKDFTLLLVKNREQIQRNAVTLDEYLDKTGGPEYEYAKRLIGRGYCFVIISSQTSYRFYPSRFMGYIGNSMEAHERMGEIRRDTGKTTRDGKKTNPAITKLLGALIKRGGSQWGCWEAEYKNFCKKLGIIPDNNERKYWQPM
jgi:hypothetical protein